MLFSESCILVGDNTHVGLVRCIRILGGSNNSYGTVGEFVVVAVQHRWKKRRLINKVIYLALVIMVKKQKRRMQGYYIRCRQNRVFMISEQGVLIGTRFLSSVCLEVRLRGLAKMLSKIKAYI